ncbi:hypothetical protein M0802_010493 [Mischocyttarus mexicanus]|nr:hypothetical protein M0802_010493 [Mischocyttarus mexicanus]
MKGFLLDDVMKERYFIERTPPKKGGNLPTKVACLLGSLLACLLARMVACLLGCFAVCQDDREGKLVQEKLRGVARQSFGSSSPDSVKYRAQVLRVLYSTRRAVFVVIEVA